MSRASTRIRRVFDRRYRIAIGLVVCGVLAAYLTAAKLSQMNANRAEAISLVANQRALSQRIAFLASSLSEAPGSEVLREEVVVATDRMERAHRVLTGRAETPDLARFLTPIRGVYFAGFLPFDAQVERFIADARAFAELRPGEPGYEAAEPLRARLTAAGTGSMMQTHGLALAIMEEEAWLDLNWTHTVYASTMLAAIVLLGLITALIFWPMSRHIEASFAGLEEAEARASRAAADADAANTAKGDFLQSASHELKTPLNAIVGFTEVLRTERGEVTEHGATDDALAQMQLAGEHLTALLDAILDTHRAEEGTLTLSEEDYTLHEPLAAASRLADGLARRRNLVFETTVDVPDTMRVTGDPVRLRQVCLNLLDNAVKFTEAGTVRLEATSTEDDDGMPWLTVTVTDTGPGIAKDRQEAVFRRYGAKGGVLARGGAGLGLGLSLTRDLAEMMGGTIKLASKEGMGTAVTLRVPLVPAEPLVRALTDDSAGAPARLPASVLIVDDNMPNRMVADALVKLSGATTTLCADGREAVAAAADEVFDLILMDISMPVMDGIEATVAIRNSDGLNADTPILAVTAHVAREEAAEVMEAGFQEVVHKPVRREVLDEAMRRWVRPRREAPAGEDAA